MTAVRWAVREAAEGRPGPLARAVDQVRVMDPVLLILRLTLLVLLVNTNDDPPLFVATAVLCAVALPGRRLVRSPWLWAALFVVVGARQVATWHTIDDHVIVTTYWCGAVALALGARDRLGTLARSACLLVGTLFAFAAGWKLLSGQFVDGTFFRYSLLFDSRFEVLSDVVGGTADHVRQAGVASVTGLLAGGGPGPVLLQEGTRASALAQVLTWWGLVLEVAIAAAFLLPLPQRWHWSRHASLAAFASTTYAVVPVGGFGSLLLVLGAAQTRTARGRLAYAAGVAATLAWSGLWPIFFLR
ncbi:MAG: hypothetical protein ACRD0N_09050 [Acidimicrobiales bacterium]